MRLRVVVAVSVVLVVLLLAITGGASSARFAATGPGQVGETPTIAMYLSVIRRAGSTPTALPTVTPNPKETECISAGPPVEEGFQVWVTHLNLGAGQEQTFCVRLIRDGLGVAGASVTADASLPGSSIILGPSLTANNGMAVFVFNTGRAPTPGTYTASVSATATADGESFSSFTTYCFTSTRGVSTQIVFCD